LAAIDSAVAAVDLRERFFFGAGTGLFTAGLTFFFWPFSSVPWPFSSLRFLPFFSGLFFSQA
jgi:hypothetical protein